MNKQVKLVTILNSMSLIKVLSYEIDFKKIEKNIFNISLGDYILS